VANDVQIEIEIVQKIKERDHETLKKVYKEIYPMVKKYVLSNNGILADAQDIFHDALYIMIQKAKSPDFILTSKLSTFVVGISRNLWLKRLNEQKSNRTLSQDNLFDKVEQIEDTEYHKLAHVKQLKKSLIALGEPCKTILEQFYFLQTPMKQIAKMLHYTNANNAKNQKYKCFMRLKKIVLKEAKNEGN